MTAGLEREPRRARGGAVLLATALIVAAMGAGACGSASATPMVLTTPTPAAESSATAEATESPAATATETPSPSTGPAETPSPARTKSGGGVTAGPPPKPNLMGLVPDLSPSDPTCNVDFKIDFQVGNKGLGDATIGTTVQVVDTRAADGVEFLRTTMNVPALAHSSGLHLYKTVKILSPGNHILTLTIDPGHLVDESNEGDNVIIKTYFLKIGGCPKP